MPTLWRLMVKDFCKYFTLILSVFIVSVLVLRMQDIARFATLGAGLKLIAKFTLFQIPNMLPLTIPLAALISAFVIMQRMSNAEELTSLRSSGLSIHEIAFPIYVLSILLAIINFVILSEITPRSVNSSKSMLTEIIYHNPLLLLKKNRLLKVKDSYAEMDMIQSGKEAKNVLFAFRDFEQDQINVVVAKKLLFDESSQLIGSGITSLHYSSSQYKDSFDNLYLENQKHTVTQPKAFWLLTSSKGKKQSISQYTTSQLVRKAMIRNDKQNRSILEILRRISTSFTVVSFVFAGIHFSTVIGRNRSRIPLLSLALLVTTTLVCFLAARSFNKNLVVAPISYLLPQILIWFFSLKRHHNLSRGICK